MQCVLIVASLLGKGKPFEISKVGIKNFEKPLQLFSLELQAELASQQIRFMFSPPSAPHFGGFWEWEIRSLKTDSP